MPKPNEAVNEDAEENTATTDSASEENNNSNVVDDLSEDDSFDDVDQSDELSEETEGEEESEQSEEEVAVETEQKPQNNKAEHGAEDKPLAPKSENRFQKLANENRELRQQIDAAKLRESQVASEQELLNEVNPATGEYYTVQEAEKVARQQTLEAQQQAISKERYDLEVQQNQSIISNEANRAVAEFPIFDESSPQFDKELAQQADALLGQSLIFDDSGKRTPEHIIGSNISPYQLYKTLAESTRAHDARNQAAAQRANEKMLASADLTGGNPPSKSKDTDFDDFDSVFDD